MNARHFFNLIESELNNFNVINEVLDNYQEEIPLEIIEAYKFQRSRLVAVTCALKTEMFTEYPELFRDEVTTEID